MPYTKCPSCRKVQAVVPALVEKEVGCMNERCAKRFQAIEYHGHSGILSRLVFLIAVAFALVMLVRWSWLNATWICGWLG